MVLESPKLTWTVNINKYIASCDFQWIVNSGHSNGKSAITSM